MSRNFGVALRQEDVVVAVRWWIVLVVGCGLLFSLDRLRVLNQIRGWAEAGLWSIDARVVGVSRLLTKPFAIVADMPRRHERIAALEDQLAMAAVDQQKLKSAQDQLALVLPMVTRYNDGVKANTVAELYTRKDLSEVSAGEIHGVIPGMAVTDKNGVLVGRIESVGRYVSRVQRVGMADFKIPAQTVSGGAKGVVYFDGTDVVLGEVLQTEPLNVGEVVVTGGAGGTLPSGLVIGQVTAIKSNDADVTKAGVLNLLAQQEGWVALW